MDVCNRGSMHDNLKLFIIIITATYVVVLHQLIEAYATMIECCQHYDFKNLANSYLQTALSQ